MLKTLLAQVKEFKLPSILTPLFMILEVICEMIIPVLMGNIVDYGINGGNMPYILATGGKMIAVALIGLFCGIMGGYFGEIKDNTWYRIVMVARDGQVYVNKGSGVRPDLNTNNEDYLVPWEVTTSTYYVESEWNDAGVEEIYLVTGANVPVSYITDKSELNGSRYLILENETSQIKKCLKLAVTVFTSDNPDGITWHKEFVKEGSNASQTGDPLYGITSKTWVLARDVQGHLGCGPDQGNPAGWWSCGPDEKKDWGVYDDEITFYADGKFVFNPGEGGQIYANKDVTVIGPGVAQAEDYLIDWQIQESTYKVTGDVLTLPEGVVIGYVANNDAITNPTYVITENTDDRLVMVANFNGISWQYIYKPKEGQNPQGGGTWYDVEGATNHWRSATITPEYW